MSNEAAERRFDSLTVGESAHITHEVTASDVDRFAELSGDTNPLHTDPSYAATTEFKTPIVHGMFLGALVSRFVGMTLPGKYSVLLTESLTFRRPVHAGDIATVEGKIAQKSEATRMVVIDLVISAADAVVADGSAHVRLLQ